MPRDLYDCTASDLATHSIEYLQRETAPRDAAAWLADRGYDAAPVYAGDDPLGFVHMDDVATDATGETLDDYLTQLTIDYMISGDAGFTAVLAALVESPVYFIGGHNHVSGVLTRADLNTAPARIYLFDRITYLEEHLRELILDRAPNWTDTHVRAGVLDDIETRHAEAEAANVALDKVHYAQFSTLESVVASVEACWRVCGFDTKGAASTELDAVTDLRNDVAHANLLVENTGGEGVLNTGRTTENLHSTLETIDEVLANLQDAGYDPETPDR